MYMELTEALWGAGQCCWLPDLSTTPWVTSCLEARKHLLIVGIKPKYIEKESWPHGSAVCGWLKRSNNNKKLGTCTSGRHSGVNFPSSHQKFLSNLEKLSACPQLRKISAYSTSAGCWNTAYMVETRLHCYQCHSVTLFILTHPWLLFLWDVSDGVSCRQVSHVLCFAYPTLFGSVSVNFASGSCESSKQERMEAEIGTLKLSHEGKNLKTEESFHWQMIV